MLVLTRKLGENIRIGTSVKVTVLEVRSGQVKLGIEAPPDIPVHREEIYQRIHGQSSDPGGRPPPTGGAKSCLLPERVPLPEPSSLPIDEDQPHLGWKPSIIHGTK